MPVKRPPLVNGEIYHIVIRAVEGLTLFKQEKDYLRFLNNVNEFNNKNPAIWSYRQHYEDRPRSSNDWRGKKESLVEILSFCLMPNHIHLLLKQTKDNGISKFMKKVGTGYGMYFNKKYERRGHVFDGRFRAVLIKDDEQLRRVFVYVYTNPVAILAPKWKEEGIKTNNLENIINFIENYKWSSYGILLGKKDCSFLLGKEELNSIIENISDMRFFVKERLLLREQTS